ncbi:MAG: MFS transporter [Nocardioidaceae bacterium]
MSAPSRTDRRWLFAVCVARVGSAAPFQAYAGALPFLRSEWDMSGTEAGTLAFVWQAAFATSLVVLSSLADRLGAGRLFVWSTWATVAGTALVPLLAQGYWSGLALFSVLALVNGGAYIPGVMLLASRFPPARRGHAIGWFLGASSLGYGLALLLIGALASAVGWRGGLLAIAGFAAASAAIALPVVRSGAPHPEREAAPSARSKHPRPKGFVRGFLGNRGAVLITVGYTAHAWELLGLWAWAPAFLAAALVTGGNGSVGATGLGVGLAAAFHLVGLAAGGFGGWLSDRWGRTAVILSMLVVSGACSFSFGWLIGAPVAVLLVVAVVYGFAAVGDSSVFSTGLTELVDPAVLGRSFAFRSFLGFGAGALASLVFGVVLDVTNPAAGSAEPAFWGWGFATLGLGAVAGIVATGWLRALPQSRQMAEGKR